MLGFFFNFFFAPFPKRKLFCSISNYICNHLKLPQNYQGRTSIVHQPCLVSSMPSHSPVIRLTIFPMHFPNASYCVCICILKSISIAPHSFKPSEYINDWPLKFGSNALNLVQSTIPTHIGSDLQKVLFKVLFLALFLGKELFLALFWALLIVPELFLALFCALFFALFCGTFLGHFFWHFFVHF